VRNLPKKKRIRAIVAAFQEYVRTYSDQAHYDQYSDKTVIDDMLYGLGIALDPERYKCADGFAKFQEFLRHYLSISASIADQPAVVMFDDRRDDPYLYPTEQTMSYQDAINAHFQQCLARGKEPDYPTWLLQAALDFLDCRDDSPNPIEAIREYLRTPDQQQDGCTSNDAGLVQPKSGTDIPTDKS
jgi:hypothetical protein